MYYLGKNKYARRIKMNIVQKIALTFTIIGAINWGLVGLFDFNLSSIVSSGGSTEKSRLSVVLANGYSPLNGLAITRPTACSPIRMLLAILQYSYNLSNGTTSVCAAI